MSVHPRHKAGVSFLYCYILAAPSKNADAGVRIGDIGQDLFESTQCFAREGTVCSQDTVIVTLPAQFIASQQVVL